MDRETGADHSTESIKMEREVKLETAAIDNEANPLTEPSDTTICQFFMMGRCRFGERCRNIHASLSEDSLPSPEKVKSSPPKGKKPPMKTATDVISRIQWDTMLPTECFTIGYLDRFLGVIEKPFSSFCWEDLASVGHDVLAIPKHRIQYFKYQSLVVWDKTTRTDNIFGSTGSGLTILDIIDQYETLMQTEGAMAQRENDLQEDYELVVENEDTAVDEYSKSMDEDNSKKHRPTHFIAVRIHNEDVTSAVKEIQSLLINSNPEMAEFCIPLAALHLTLCLLHLNTPEEIQKALLVLQELKCEIQRTLPPSLILGFEGVRDFHSRILYVAPTGIPELRKFTHILKHGFQSKDLTVIDPPDSNSFHVTIAKVPRNILRKNPNLVFSKEVCENIRLSYFGAQQIDSLSFCYAGSSRRTDGFYTTLMEFPLY
ncbi:leukocyte receptor cluster member 9 [Rhinophrynus dorsalis]